MCNQCEDMRRIHGSIKLWVVKQDGRSVYQLMDESQAERAIAILRAISPDSVFEIIETNSAETRWG
jgi:hypothetical protein